MGSDTTMCDDIYSIWPRQFSLNGRPIILNKSIRLKQDFLSRSQRTKVLKLGGSRSTYLGCLAMTFDYDHDTDSDSSSSDTSEGKCSVYLRPRMEWEWHRVQIERSGYLLDTVLDVQRLYDQCWEGSSDEKMKCAEYARAWRH